LEATVSGSAQLTELPSFLRGSEAFLAHLRDQFAESDNQQKGDNFVAFACKLLPLCDFCRDFGEPTVNPKKTADKGVDFEARHQNVENFDSAMRRLANFLDAAGDALSNALEMKYEGSGKRLR
jgi:hypothetical protein